MNILEYILKDDAKNVDYDEEGNGYYYFADNYNIPYAISYLFDVDISGTLFVPKDLLSINIIMPDGFDYSSDAKYPYFRLRGIPIKEDQAFDIIRRTDSLFSPDSKAKDYVSICHFSNHLGQSHILSGWVHPDGAIANNANMYKYPELHEVIGDLSAMLINFPYLDLVVAITEWDSMPIDCYEDYPPKRDFELPEYDEDFFKNIIFGVHIHDKTIEILNRKETVKKYQEFDALYPTNRDRFSTGLCRLDEKTNREMDKEYIRRCVEANGYDYEEVVANLPKFEREDFLVD